MTLPPTPFDIPESERTPLVKWLQEIIAAQQQVIEHQQSTIANLATKMSELEGKVSTLDEQLKAAKKLKSKPKIRASTLNQQDQASGEGKKRAGSAKQSKKLSFVVDEERVIEPALLPTGSTWNGYREYDVQELVLKRHNIRFLLGEYVTLEGTTVVGKIPGEYQGGHYGPTLVSFVLYQHHHCRVPQNLIVEQLTDLGVDISAGQINRMLIENKEPFHAEQQEVLRVGLETAEYVHTDDTGARHQGQNGFCTVIGNDLFAYFSSTRSTHSGKLSADIAGAVERLRA